MINKGTETGPSAVRVVLSNVFADDNRGGAAITLESIRAARAVFPNCSISLVAVAAGSDGESHRHTLAEYPDAELLQPLVGVPSGRLGPVRGLAKSFALLVQGGRRPRSRTLQRIREAEFVMSKGGQLFKDRRTMSGLVSVWLSSLPLIMGWRLGKPTFIYAATIGPIKSKRARVVVGWIIRRATWIFVRDSRSRAEALSLGVSPNRIVQMPDCVFGRKPPDASHCASVASRFGLTAGSFASVTVKGGKSRADQHERFLRELSSVMKELLDLGIVDRVAIVAQVDGEVSSDMKENRSFLDLCDDDRFFIMDTDLSPEDMTAFYGAGAMTVGCRVHSAIFSLVAGTPTWVSTMSGVKAYDLLQTLGLEEFVLPYPDFDTRRLTVEILDHLERPSELQRRIKLAVGDARSRVDLARDRLGIVVRSNGSGPPQVDAERESNRTGHDLISVKANQ